MKKAVVITLFTGAGVLFLSSFAKANSLFRFGQDLTVDNEFDGEFDGNTLLLTVNTVIKNPSPESLHFRHPFIKLKISKEGRTVATSDLKNVLYELKPFEQLRLEPITFRLSFVQMVQIAIALGKDIYKTKTLNLAAETVTNIVLVSTDENGNRTEDNFPFSKTENVNYRLPFI